MGPKINVGSEPQPTLILGFCKEPYLKQDVSQKTPHGMQVGAMRVSKRPQLHLRWALNQCRFGAPTDIDFRMLQGALFETRSVPEDPSLYASWRHESPKETSTPPKRDPKINVGSEPQPTLILEHCKEPYLKQEVSQKTPHGMHQESQLHQRWALKSMSVRSPNRH